MRVLHYTQKWLELSQGFVYQYVVGSRYRSVVVSRRSPIHREAFPYQPVWSLEAVEWIGGHVGHRPRSTLLEALAALYRVDVVHVHLGYDAPDVQGLVRRRSLPLVLSLHGSDVTSLPRQKPKFYDALIPITATVVVPSVWLGERVVALGFDASRVSVVPSGVDTAFFSPSPLSGQRPIVAFVGRLVAKKGIDILLDAWPEVSRAAPDALLEIVGDGPMAGRVAAACGPTVRWSRPNPSDRHGQVRALLRSATVVATPSHTAPDGDAESLLLVNLEAAACGRAVVTTRHGGIPEYVREGHSALLVPEADRVALADALIAVLRDPGLAERLGGAGPAWAAQFDVAACTARRDDVVGSAIGGPRPQRRGSERANRD